jgi:hypothetical protein
MAWEAFRRAVHDAGPAPFLGRRNNEIYMELLNLSTEEMKQLKREKNI